MIKNVCIRLDEDLRALLRDKLHIRQLDWSLLPATIQLRFLRPFLKEQERREASVVEAARA